MAGRPISLVENMLPSALFAASWPVEKKAAFQPARRAEARRSDTHCTVSVSSPD